MKSIFFNSTSAVTLATVLLSGAAFAASSTTTTTETTKMGRHGNHSKTKTSTTSTTTDTGSTSSKDEVSYQIGSAAKSSASMGDKVKGISFSFPNGGNPTMGGSYFLDEDHSLRVEFGFDMTNTTSTSWGASLEAGYRTYCHKAASLKFFHQGNLFLAKDIKGATFANSLIIAPGAAVGAEYFVNESVSVGVSTGMAFTFSNKFNDFRLATGTSAITGNFYF